MSGIQGYCVDSALKHSSNGSCEHFAYIAFVFLRVIGSFAQLALSTQRYFCGTAQLRSILRKLAPGPRYLRTYTGRSSQLLHSVTLTACFVHL